MFNKNFIKIIKFLTSRIGSMLGFSLLTSMIILFISSHKNLDEHLISSPCLNNLSNSIGISNLNKFSFLGIVLAPEVRKKVVEDIKYIDFPIVEKVDPYLIEGQKSIITPGSLGQKITMSEYIIINNNIVQINELFTKQINPISQQVAIGIKTPIQTPFGYPIEFGEDGYPTQYEDLLLNKRVTAYTAGPNDKTATGSTPVLGVVAVKPNEIPYHSIIYLEILNDRDPNSSIRTIFSEQIYKCDKNNPHQGYIVGPFIAKDTGSGKFSIDIFFNNEDDCWNCGVKLANILVVKKGKIPLPIKR